MSTGASSRAFGALTLSMLTLLPSTPAHAASDALHTRLVDQRGHDTQIAEFSGRPVVVTFVATRCTDACPIANAAFAALERRLKRDHVAAMLLTITLDPEHDSALAMARLAANFAADPARWRFLSGGPQEIRAVMRAFGVRATPGPAGIPDEHTSFVYLLDARGKPQSSFLVSTNLADTLESTLLKRPSRAALWLTNPSLAVTVLRPNHSQRPLTGRRPTESRW